MKSVFLKISIVFVIIIIICLIIFPFVEIDTGDKIIKFSYSDDISKYEENPCYGENYFYNEEKDVSIYYFTFYEFLFFHVFVLEYEEGNICDSEYLLEEEYISNFLNNAVITSNSNNIDLGSLIIGKTPVVSNKKYYGNDYETFIEYELDEKYQIMYIFYVDDLLVIQVGLSDEGPKFIAYK